MRSSINSFIEAVAVSGMQLFIFFVIAGVKNVMTKADWLGLALITTGVFCLFAVMFMNLPSWRTNKIRWIGALGSLSCAILTIPLGLIGIVGCR